MATKIYNRVTYTFIINGEAVSFYCSTTDTRNGFCHHVYTWGKGKDGEHTRISYFNRTWERFETISAGLSTRRRNVSYKRLRLIIRP